MLNITVKVEKVLERQSFISKRDGATVNRYSFVAVTTAEQYPKTICFSCLGDDTWANLHIMEGNTYHIYFDIASREWNGKYYTDVNAFRAEWVDKAAPEAPKMNHTGGTDFRRSMATQHKEPSAVQPAPAAASDNVEDFPF